MSQVIPPPPFGKGAEPGERVSQRILEGQCVKDPEHPELPVIQGPCVCVWTLTPEGTARPFVVSYG